MIYLQKSLPAPESLAKEQIKKSGKYDSEDVLTRLHADFKNKCYICELHQPTIIQTEHFVPHKGDVNLKFDWNNLFFSCGHCNHTKGSKNEYNNILNCTVIEDGVDSRIAHRVDSFPQFEARFEIVNTDVKVTNTVALLNAVYNGKTFRQKLEASNLRAALEKELEEFEQLTSAYLSKDNSVISLKDICNIIIKHLRSDKGGFTAFKRWIIRDNPVLNQEFGAFCR